MPLAPTRPDTMPGTRARTHMQTQTHKRCSTTSPTAPFEGPTTRFPRPTQLHALTGLGGGIRRGFPTTYGRLGGGGGRVASRCRRGQAASERRVQEWAPHGLYLIPPQQGKREDSGCRTDGEGTCFPPAGTAAQAESSSSSATLLTKRPPPPRRPSGPHRSPQVPASMPTPLLSRSLPSKWGGALPYLLGLHSGSLCISVPPWEDAFLCV